jgi:prepilin-type N-terminal cleavage/methylation domain-containing protein
MPSTYGSIDRKEITPMPRFFRRSRAPHKAFTLLELVVVIVVIGILSTVAITTYSGIITKAHRSVATNAARTTYQQMSLEATSTQTPIPVGIWSRTPLTGELAISSLSYGADVSPLITKIVVADTGLGTGAISMIGDGNFCSGTTVNLTPGGGPAVGTMTCDTAQAPSRTNLSLNPNFELDAANWAVQWFGNGGSGVSGRSALAAHSGSYGLRKTWTVAGASSDDTGFTYSRAVTPGQTFTYSAWLRSSRAQNINPWMIYYDSLGAFLANGGFNTVPVNLPANTWVRVTLTNTVPAGAAIGSIDFSPYFSGINWVAGDTLDIDDALFEQSPTLGTYFDGSTPPSGNYTYAWTGAANASTSVAH